MGKRNRIKLNPERMLKVVAGLVQLAEMLHPEAKTGAQKKSFAVQTLTDRLDLPILGEAAEAAVWSVLVDLVVAGFNQAEGKWGVGN